MSEGRGGYWNRAGRRSGGARPTVVHIPRYAGVLVICEECGNDRIPLLATSGCLGCREAAALVEKMNREFGEEAVLRAVATPTEEGK